MSTTTPWTYHPNMTVHIYDSYGLFIHPHWYQFEPVSTTWHYAMGFFITIVSIFGSLGNLLVMYVFATTKSLRTPSNMFVVNLSMSDFLFSIIQGFPLMSLSCFHQRWIFGKVACELYGLIGGIFGLMSINTLAVIAFDRYHVIARPIKASRTLSFKKAFFRLLFVWTWSSIWPLPPLFGWGDYIPEGFQTSCTFDYLTRSFRVRTFILCLYVFGFVAPLSIIVFCYYHIFKAVATHEHEMNKMAKELNAEIRQVQNATKYEIKTARIAMTIIITFILSWLPYATVALIGQFGPQRIVTPYVCELPVMFAKASAMHNPLIYAMSHPRFREAMNLRCPWLLCCCGLAVHEKEENGSGRAGQREKTQVERMDSIYSTAPGGAPSQISEMSNLDSDIGFDESASPISSVSIRMTRIRKTTSSASVSADIAALVTALVQQQHQQHQQQQENRQQQHHQEPQQHQINTALIRELITAVAGVMTTQGGSQQPNSAELTSNILENLAHGRDEQGLQNAIQTALQGQVPTTTEEASPETKARCPPDTGQPSVTMVTTKAEVNVDVSGKLEHVVCEHIVDEGAKSSDKLPNDAQEV